MTAGLLLELGCEDLPARYVVALSDALADGIAGGLKKRGVIDKGMRPKMQSAVRALQEGVQRVHFIDGRMPHSLLLEIFTDKGVGTEIVHG